MFNSNFESLDVKTDEVNKVQFLNDAISYFLNRITLWILPVV